MIKVSDEQLATDYITIINHHHHHHHHHHKFHHHHHHHHRHHHKDINVASPERTYQRVWRTVHDRPVRSEPPHAVYQAKRMWGYTM